ncbi:glycine-rich RNA-binding protein 2, mitochondrial-like [Vicia villosa]|uniref:glycine-rich RNA-binding protein 2, mitochondrial-like n=1 Tax=Vicia villosa TaxID=3911 RepID=UPI00273AABF9|nr:glycine-rich RNA-binding protein 2, mitochondrial-like [Vicia villosa]
MRTATTIANNRTLLLQCSPLPLPQLFLRVRHHSSTKLFVAGLSYNTNETVLRDTFEQHGEIIEVKVICDHKTGESKEYGFVRFNSETAAATARKELHGKIVDGRRIRVGYAHKG